MVAISSHSQFAIPVVQVGVLVDVSHFFYNC